MIDTKITFGIYDIFSYLIPGLAGVFFLFWVLDIESFSNSTLFTTSVFVFSFILGNLFQIVGSLLFYYVDKYRFKKDSLWFKLIDFIDNSLSFMKIQGPDKELKNVVYEQIKKKVKIKPKQINPKLFYFQVADVLVARAGYEERGILLAKESFYRSLIALTLFINFLLFYFKKLDKPLLTVFIVVVLVELFRRRREYFKSIKNTQIYLLALKELGYVKL